MRKEIIAQFEIYNMTPVIVKALSDWEGYIYIKGVGFRVATGPTGTANSIVKTAMGTLKSLGKI